MQNKPNLLNAQINVNKVLTKDYENEQRFKTPGKQTQPAVSKVEPSNQHVVSLPAVSKVEPSNHSLTGPKPNSSILHARIV